MADAVDGGNVVSFKQRLRDAGLSETPTPNAAPRRPIVVPISAAGGDSYGRKALEEECLSVANCREGSRNDQLNTSAFNLASLVASGHLEHNETTERLIAAARHCGLSEAEIMPTIKSAFRGSDAKVGARVVPELEPAAVPRATAGARSLGGDVQKNRTAPDTEHDDDETTPPLSTLEEIEADFWQERSYLTLIYDAAIARMASPWAVLACCMARALALVPPHFVLPPIIGAEGSLNWFAAISAKSGGGKGAAMAVAESLLPRDVNVKGIGSGEGMIEVYQRSDKDNAPEPVTSVLFSIEEIDSLGAMGGRSGQTTMAILRQGFSGEKLGYSYRGRQGEVVVKHSYRMTVVASVQPERAGVLFEDAGGGTPQRFMWFPGRDKRITADTPPWPSGTLTLPRSLDDIETEMDFMGSGGGHRPFKRIRTPAVLDRTIREARAASMSGDDDALNSHALFCREKFALGLAILDGRLDAISEDDWALSGIASAVSDWCRTKAQEGYARGRQRQSRERGEMRAHETDEQNIVAAAMGQKRASRIANLIVKHLGEHGPSTDKELYRYQASRDRGFFAAALLAAADAGLVVKSGEKWELP